ncbi:hypothetical protein VTK56DRAFT_1032 [Thermocarpiscus australiensis]
MWTFASQAAHAPSRLASARGPRGLGKSDLRQEDLHALYNTARKAKPSSRQAAKRWFQTVWVDRKAFAGGKGNVGIVEKGSAAWDPPCPPHDRGCKQGEDLQLGKSLRSKRRARRTLRPREAHILGDVKKDPGRTEPETAQTGRTPCRLPAIQPGRPLESTGR